MDTYPTPSRSPLEGDPSSPEVQALVRLINRRAQSSR